MTAYSKNKCCFYWSNLGQNEVSLLQNKIIRVDEILWHEQTSRFFFTQDLKRHMSSYDHQSVHIFPPERHVMVVTGMQSREAGVLEYSLTVMCLLMIYPATSVKDEDKTRSLKHGSIWLVVLQRLMKMNHGKMFSFIWDICCITINRTEAINMVGYYEFSCIRKHDS